MYSLTSILFHSCSCYMDSTGRFSQHLPEPPFFPSTSYHFLLLSMKCVRIGPDSGCPSIRLRRLLRNEVDNRCEWMPLETILRSNACQNMFECFVSRHRWMIAPFHGPTCRTVLEVLQPARVSVHCTKQAMTPLPYVILTRIGQMTDDSEEDEVSSFCHIKIMESRAPPKVMYQTALEMLMTCHEFAPNLRSHAPTAAKGQPLESCSL